MRGLTRVAEITLSLVRCELRIGFRRLFSRLDGAPRRVSIALVVGALLVFHLLAWPAAGWLAAAQDRNGPGPLYPAIAGAVLFVLPWLVSQAVNGVARAFYARGDLELTLSAPISPIAILAARCLAVAMESAVSVGVFAAPFADAAALRAGWRWLAIYPVLLAGALLATAVGAAIAFALFRLLGPRRTRFFAQLAAAAIGAAFVLSVQAAAILPIAVRMRLLSLLQPAHGASAYQGLVWLPAGAVTGEPRALLGWILACVATFVAVVGFLGPAFAAFAARAAGASSPGRPSAGRSRPVVFASGEGRALRRKEWRLLRRDPWLASQLLLQVVYSLPIGVLLWRSPALHGEIALAAGPTIVVVACQISASFAWLVVSSEEAPELLSTAPVSRRTIEIQKLEAIAPPLAILLAPPLAALAVQHAWAAAVTLVFAVLAATSSALLNFWHPAPGRRNQVLRRHAQSKLVGVMEHLLSLTWAIAVCLALLGSALALAPAAVALALLYLNRPRRRGGVRVAA